MNTGKPLARPWTNQQRSTLELHRVIRFPSEQAQGYLVLDDQRDQNS